MRRPRSAFGALAFLLAVSWPASLVGQDRQVSMEVGAAHAFPPSGTDAAAATYGLAALRLDYWADAGSGLYASVSGGRALTNVGSDFVSAVAGGQAWAALASAWSVGVAGEAYGFHVSLPFQYEAVTGKGGPRVRWHSSWAAVTLGAEVGTGQSTVELRRGDRVRRGTRDLWFRGGMVDTRWRLGRLTLGASAGSYSSGEGLFKEAGIDVTGTVGGALVQLSVAGWRTPSGDEVTGGMAVQLPMGAWSTHALGLRTAPDPLVGTAGGAHGGVTLSRRLVRLGGERDVRVYRVHSGEDRARVEFRLGAEATRLELVGDFSAWEPVAMRRVSDEWFAELELKPGVYHFGFLADGEWYLPPRGVPGRVSDEWGRENGTLVVPDPAGK